MQSKLTDLHNISQKVGLEINYSKTEEIRINTKLKKAVTPENRDIKRVPNFTYLGSNVSEDGGAGKDIDIRIQKARGAFSRLRRIWQSTFIHKDTKIKIFNACVKSVLLYGCRKWLVTSCIQRKLQTFVNRCLRYILRI
jgi:hypothetical protein